MNISLSHSQSFSVVYIAGEFPWKVVDQFGAIPDAFMSFKDAVFMSREWNGFDAFKPRL